MSKNAKKTEAVVGITPVVTEARIGEFVAEAQMLDSSEIKVCRANTDVFYANALKGVAALSTPEAMAVMKRDLPQENAKQLLELPELVAALGHVASQAALDDVSTKISNVIAQAIPMRKQVDLQIRLAVSLGLVPPVAAQALPQLVGRSPAALGNRLIDSVLLLKKYASAFDGRMLLSEEFLNSALDVAGQLKRRGSNRLIKNRIKDERPLTELRDRLYSLAIQRYDRMRRVGAFLFGSEAGKKVPAPNSRRVVRSSTTDQRVVVGPPAATVPASTPVATNPETSVGQVIAIAPKPTQPVPSISGGDVNPIGA